MAANPFGDKFAHAGLDLPAPNYVPPPPPQKVLSEEESIHALTDPVSKPPTPGPVTIGTGGELPPPPPSPTALPPESQAQVAPPHAIKEVQITPGQLPEGVPPPPPGTTSYKFSGTVPAPGYAQHLKDYEASVAQGDLLGDSMNATLVADASAAAKEKDAAVSEGQRRSDEFDKHYDAAQARMQSLRDQRDGLIEQLGRYELDPDKYFKSQSAMSSFNTGIGLMVGGMMQGGGYTTDNPALTQLNKAVDRQIEADKLQLNTRIKQLDYVTDAQKQEMLDSTEMRLMQGVRREQYWDMVSRRMDAEAAKRGVDIKSQGYEISKNMIDQQRKAAKLQNDRLAMQAAMSAAAAQRKHDEELRKWALERGIQVGQVSDGSTNPITAGASSYAFAKGVAPVARDAEGNPTLIPQPQITKGGAGDMWKTSPEQASKQQALAGQAAMGKLAFEEYSDLQNRAFGGVNLSASDRARKSQLESVLSRIGKQAGENSDLDLEIRKAGNIPGYFMDEKARLNMLNMLESTLYAPLHPTMREVATKEYQRLKGAQVK